MYKLQSPKKYLTQKAHFKLFIIVRSCNYNIITLVYIHPENILQKTNYSN